MSGRLSKEQLVRRVAAELQPGEVVGLGPGLPALVPTGVPLERRIMFLAPSGVVGYTALSGQEVSDLGYSAGLLPGAAIVDVAEAACMLRSGRLDVGVVEAVQVSERGDVVLRAGSTSEIACGVRRLIALMEHTDHSGESNLVRECTDIVSAGARVELIVTDAAVIEVSGEGLVLRELAPGLTVEEVRRITATDLTPAGDLREMDFSLTPERPVAKVYSSGADAVADIGEGATILLDGFAGPGGMAQYLLLCLRDQGARDLTIVSNTAGIANSVSFGTPRGFRTVDHSVLVENGQVRKAVASFPASPSPSRPNAFELAYKRGQAELELVPQGTLAERIRAGGSGLAAFYTPTGAGTLAAEGKQTHVFNGRECVLEQAIRGDFALLRAHKADTMGNLVYRGTSRSFNATMAPAADVTIVEVDEIVKPGELDPDAIVTPGIYVQRIVRRPPDFSPFEPV